MRPLALASLGVFAAGLTSRAAFLPPRSLQGPSATAPVGSEAQGFLPWEDLTEADWIYPVATRVATLDGHAVHYPTPTAELAAALEARSETAALRHLAEARIELGDRKGAVTALERWAGAAGGEAWAEAARWGAAHLEWDLAFRAAERALPGLAPESRRALASERIAWADAHPEAADPIALREARARLLPEDTEALEDWIRALEKAGRLEAAEAALANAAALAPERRLLLRSDLLADHGQDRRALEVLDAAISEPWGLEVRRAYAARTDKGNPTAPEAWRASLERGFEPLALVRLAAYFEGQGRGGAAADLLRQVERRHEAGLDRAGWLLLARLWEEIDAVPEAFRGRLAATQKGLRDEQTADLAPLARLALKAGGRPLAWGTYNDEPYRWVARVDRTPGFWTGGVSFLLTGQDWKQALARLESESLPQRTFETARTLEAELARRAPGHPELPSLRVAIMARHIERGEGREALALLPVLEGGPTGVANEARRVALLALRQVERPLAEELRLYRARLKALAPDGSKPEMATVGEDFDVRSWEPAPKESWRRLPRRQAGERYPDVLRDATARMEQRDRSHRAGLDLVLGELDRLPDAEALWAELAGRLEDWNLDDDLGPRYERALERFQGRDWWSRAARWYARRSRQRDLRRLAEEIAARFRGAEIFARAEEPGIAVQIPEQPTVGGRVRLVAWADWVRLKALERFPHSPLVFREAVGRLLTRSQQVRGEDGFDSTTHRAVVEDALLDERRWALLFVDRERREEYFARAMREDRLEARLAELETRSESTPVEDQILFEGWSRLSRFERAWPAADRLAAAYPGNGDLARRVLALHRSLAGLETSHAAPARAVVERTAPTLTDPSALWTELGELEQERGRPEAALATWRKLVGDDPRNPDRISELATLLWDYGWMREALDALETGRRLMQRPRFMAFEAGVLREEVRDIDGAIGEYLGSLQPEQGDCFCSWFEHDQRSLRRLAQLLRRERVLLRVEERIAELRPGVRADEQVLASLFPLGTIELPDRVSEWDADDWIDRMDLPNDPLGRAERAARQEQARPRERAGIRRAGEALLARTLAMVPQAGEAAFLDAAEAFFESLPEPQRAGEREVTFRSAVLARRAALAPTEEAAIGLEVERARYLFARGRRAEADAVWAALEARIGALPEGAPRMRAEAERAAYLERSRGTDDAALEWQRLAGRYPWSLGLLEDRLDFLQRSGRGEEARGVLEAVIPRAATGHREALLERLARESLEARDLPRARRAVEQLLAGTLEDDRRLGADHLLLRLLLREDPGFDPFPLAKTESPKLKPEREADLYAQLARAAGAEQAWAKGLGLWIEALNRRTERAWIREACRAADKAGRADALADFFEKQRARSPRDVRWAVAVREIRLARHDLEGAIEVAKAAVAVRPEREALWREAVDLMLRAGQVKQAAEYLGGWQQPRPADEDVVRWRGELLARAGEGEKLLDLERAAFDAFARQATTDDKEDREGERNARRARAAGRLLEHGYPRLAWRFLAPDDDVRNVTGSPLGGDEQARLALATGNFARLLRQRAGDQDFRQAAASVLREHGTPEHKEDVQAFLLARLLPAAAGGAAFRGDDAALALWWPFVTEAGLERALRVAFARRYVAASVGPWRAEAPFPFVEAVAQSMIGRRDGHPVFASPELSRLWCRDLVRRDRAEELGAFLDGRLQELLSQVRGPVPLKPTTPRLSWTPWLDDRAAFETWVRWLGTRPDRVTEIGAVLAERRLWDRFWVLAARGWDLTPLLAAVGEESRTAWFRHWQVPSPRDKDPQLAARGETIERVSLAVGHLVAGVAGAAGDPLIAKLRGPRSVGAVLGGDDAWSWPEFTPRRSPAGENLELGEDRVIGQRADTGRLPGALWGDRPGEAWYVLETLARLREHDAEVPFVPLETPQRGREGARSLLAVRLAEALGDPALAVALDEAHPPAGADLARLDVRLRIGLAAGQNDKASAILGAEARRLQPTLGEATYRAMRRLAEDLGLPAPLELMDPATPVSPSLLAFLYDHLGPASSGRFQPKDAVDFRAALAARWRGRDAALDAARVRYLLTELWASGASTLPRQGLRALGGVWPHAADWLERLPLADRPEALAALDALPDATRLSSLLAREANPREETVRLLRLRVHLARGEDQRALALVDQMLAELAQPEGLALAPVSPGTSSSEEEGEEQESYATGPSPAFDPAAARLAAWLAPFRDAKRVELVAERFRSALRARREEGPVPVSVWALAFELDAGPALIAELENAWIRGDWRPEELAPLVDVVSKQAPAEAPRWLARWPQAFSFDHVARRARILVALKDVAGVQRVLAEGRRRAVWTAAEDLRGFDLWRAQARADSPKAATPAAEAPPATWARALPFWKRRADEIGPDLAHHLKEHPFDLLAVRAVLRTVAPGDEESLRVASAVLDDPTLHQIGDPSGDAAFVRIRIARGLLPTSARAAREALGYAGADVAFELKKRRMPPAEIDATLADLTRVAAQHPTREALESTLEDRDPERARALRAESRQKPRDPPTPYRLVSGRPEPWRPRDLDWIVVAAALDAEAVR